MNKNGFGIIITILAVVLTVGIATGYVIHQNKTDSSQEINQEANLGGQAGHIINVVGSRVGTTTTAVQFTDNNATTSYPTLIGRHYDSVIFNVKAKTIDAGGGNNVYFSILASSDYDCDTATTSPDVGNPVLMQDINWFDAGNHIRNLDGSTTLPAATTTISWLPTTEGQGTKLIVDDLNTNCLRLDVNASGTTLFIQAERKTFN